jgi:uncharacterized OsmC-like protein
MITTAISATVTWKDGNRFVGRSGSGFELEVEEPRAGVPGGAPSPTELALIALGTCTGVVVAGVLVQGGEQLRGLQIEVEATPLDTNSRQIGDIRLRYRVAGDVSLEKVERAVDLSSDALWILKDMLGAKAEIHQEFEVMN